MHLPAFVGEREREREGVEGRHGKGDRRVGMCKEAGDEKRVGRERGRRVNIREGRERRMEWIRGKK